MKQNAPGFGTRRTQREGDAAASNLELRAGLAGPGAAGAASATRGVGVPSAAVAGGASGAAVVAAAVNSPSASLFGGSQDAHLMSPPYHGRAQLNLDDVDVTGTSSMPRVRSRASLIEDHHHADAEAARRPAGHIVVAASYKLPQHSEWHSVNVTVRPAARTNPKHK